MRKFVQNRYIQTVFILFLLFLAGDFFCIRFLNMEQQQKENMIYQTAYDIMYKGHRSLLLKELMEGRFTKEQIELGREKLSINGFDDSYQSFYEQQMREAAIRVSIGLLLIYLLLCGLIYRMYLKQSQDEKKKLFQIEMILTSFQSSVYHLDYNFNQEGELASLYARLDSLGEKLKFSEEQMLYEKEKTKTMVTDISHQLKTPLASLKTFFDLLAEDELSERERNEFLERCQSQIEHLHQLTASLINISRMEKGMIEIKKTTASIIDTIAEAVSSVYSKAQEKRIEVEMNRQSFSDDIVIPHDRKWTKEALVNVLDNAVKYSPVDTRIQINVLARSSFLRIEIADEGVGIPKNEYHQIFKRFYRGSSSELEPYEGSGVGLYLAREILEKQQGSIIVTSHRLEKMTGSTFIIHLPYTDETV